MAALTPMMQGKICLVTGATSGIGLVTAQALARQGATVVLVGRNPERSAAVVSRIQQETGNPQVSCLIADLSVQAQRTRLINALRDGERHVAAVCNNSGFSSYGKFQDLPLDGELEQVRVNVLALLELTGAFVPAMLERRTGAILNVASIAGFQPVPNQATYGATKAFVVSLSEAVHTDLGGTGVSCTALCPGPVHTEFTEVAGMTEVEDAAPDFVWLEPAEVAKAGVDGMVRGKRMVFPSMTHQAFGVAGRVAPRSVLLPLYERFGPTRGR